MTLAGRALRATRLYRPALWGYWKYRYANEHLQSLGVVGGLMALFKLRARSGATGRTLSLQIPGSRSPFFFREATADAWVFRQIFVQRQYEVEVSPEPHLIIDAGANIGCASVFFACRYPQATILAIEPDTANFEMLKINAAPYRNIVPIEKELQFDAGIDQLDGRKIFVSGRLTDGDTLLSEADALFVKLKPGQP